MLAIEDEAIVHAILKYAHALTIGCLRAGFVHAELEAADYLLERDALWQWFHHMHECMQMIWHNLILAEFDLRVMVWNAAQLLVHKFAHRGEFEGGLGNVAEPDAGVRLEREHGHTRAAVIIIARGAVHGAFKPWRGAKGEGKKREGW